MAEQERALVICAHDDDEVIACGGTIRRLANRGIEVTTVIFANGNEGYIRMDQKDSIVALRLRERVGVQKVLGTKEYITYEYHDFDNLDNEHVYHAVMKAVRRVRPRLVLTHYPAEYLAHRTLATIAPEAVMQSAWQCSLELGEPWQVEKILQFTVLDLLPHPTHILDISDTFEEKMKAMKAYASQAEVLRDILQAVAGRAKYYGAMIGVEYAEAFVLSPKVVLRRA